VAGREELHKRRIGRNKRAAMMTSLAYLDAQNATLTLAID
jgi:hypothetical protein